MSHADDKLVNFESFLNDTGVKYDRKAIRFFCSPVHGYGVEALCDLKVGQNLATIPTTGIFSIETSTLWIGISRRATYLKTAGSDPSNMDVITAYGPPCPRDALCPSVFQLPAALLFEFVLGEKSRWWHYIRILRQSLSHIGVPLSLSDEDVTKLFYGTSIDDMTVRMRSNLKDAFKNSVHQLLRRRASELSMDLQKVDSLSDADLIWAFSCVTSRAFQIARFHGNSMVPVADMFNHRTNLEHVHIVGDSDDSSVDSDDDSSDDSSDNSENESDGNDCTSDQENNCNGKVVEPYNESTDISGLPMNDEPINGKSEVQGISKGKRVTDGNGDLSIVCVRAGLKGEELFNTFGERSNTSLYLNYGFTEKDNPYDSAYFHKRDVEAAVKAWSDRHKDNSTRRMTDERKNLIEEASIVIYDEVTDDHFEVYADGNLSHGFVSLLYLHVTNWDELEQFSDDSMDILQHLMELSMKYLMSRNRDDVCEIVAQLVGQQLTKLEKNASREDDLEILRREQNDEHLHAARIRTGQRAALDAAYRIHVRDVGTVNDKNRIAPRKRVKV